MCTLLCFELNIHKITIRDEDMCLSPVTYLAKCVLPSPVTVLAKENSDTNSFGFVTGDYDVKGVEKEKKDSYNSYDKTGPKLKNATVVNAGDIATKTSESIKETVNNDSVSADGGKYIVTIDPGHSKVSTGSSANGIKEEEYTLEIGTLLYQMMKQDKRFEVHMTRTTQVGVENSKRPQISNKYNSDCFLSIHLNYYESSSAHGTETEVNYSGKGKTSLGMGNRQYARIVQNYMQRATGFTDRGLTNRPNLAVLKNNNAAAALVEIGFLSNPAEAAALKKNKKKYAKGLYNAFAYIANKYPKPSEKGSVTEASSSKLNSSLTSNVSLSNVAKASKVVKTGKFRSADGKHSTGTYSIAGRKYTVYSQSKGTTAWCSSHGDSATVLATILSSAGYGYTADQIHSAGADKDYSVKAAIKSHGIKNGTNSDYDVNANGNPITCFGMSAIMRNMGLSCDYVATWSDDKNAVNDITAALAQGRCVAVYVNNTKKDGIQFSKGNHCILLVGFQKNGCINFIDPAGGRLNYTRVTGKCNSMTLSTLAKYYMIRNTEKANQVIFHGTNRSGGYVKF